MSLLTIKEAAEFLNMGESTLYRKLRTKSKKQKIPGAKLDGKWLFVKEDLIEYLRSFYHSQEKINKRVSLWQLKDEAKKVSTPSNSRLQMETEYESLLELPTKYKQQN